MEILHMRSINTTRRGKNNTSTFLRTCEILSRCSTHPDTFSNPERLLTFFETPNKLDRLHCRMEAQEKTPWGQQHKLPRVQLDSCRRIYADRLSDYVQMLGCQRTTTDDAVVSDEPATALCSPPWLPDFERERTTSFGFISYVKRAE